jgi:hypothetical protein
MPRMKDETNTLLADLTSRLQRLVDVARKEGRETALSDVRSLVGGGMSSGGAAPAKRRGRPLGSKNKPKTAKSGRKRKNPWASMTPEQRKDRVRKMLAGRGLKPRD